MEYADMAESADALDSGSSRGQLGGGSSPLIRTKKKSFIYAGLWLIKVTRGCEVGRPCIFFFLCVKGRNMSNYVVVCVVIYPLYASFG